MLGVSCHSAGDVEPHASASEVRGAPVAELPSAPAPPENPTTAEKVLLGRHLFYDTRLSQLRNVSCASCHKQALAFTDGLAVSLGTTGQKTARSAMSLVNTGYSATYTFANSVLKQLEPQALVPLVGENPVELGMSGRDALLRARLLSEPRYPSLFTAAFPNDPEPYTLQNVARALASFQRTLVSTRAPYDRYTAGERTALSASAQRGLALFRSERLGCASCHDGLFFSSAMSATPGESPRERFENNGLYAEYPVGNRGMFELSGLAEDMGKFKPPTLRNIALTAPYMHDGSLATLSEVLDHYARGGQPSATKSPLIRGFSLRDEERADVLAFLESLTDEALLHDERFTDPWDAAPRSP